MIKKIKPVEYFTIFLPSENDRNHKLICKYQDLQVSVMKKHINIYNENLLIGYHISNNPDFINYMKENIKNTISERQKDGLVTSYLEIERDNYIKNLYFLYPLIKITYKKEKDKLNISRFDAFCTAKSSGHQLLLEFCKKEKISEICLTAEYNKPYEKMGFTFFEKDRENPHLSILKCNFVDLENAYNKLSREIRSKHRKSLYYDSKME